MVIKPQGEEEADEDLRGDGQHKHVKIERTAGVQPGSRERWLELLAVGGGLKSFVPVANGSDPWLDEAEIEIEPLKCGSKCAAVFHVRQVSEVGQFLKLRIGNRAGKVPCVARWVNEIGLTYQDQS